MSATDATASAAAAARPAPDYGWRLHAKFLDRCLRSLGPHASHDVNRMTLAFFSLSGLAVLPHSTAAGRPALDEYVDSQRRTQLADWILNLQVRPRGFEEVRAVITVMSKEAVKFSTLDRVFGYGS